MLIERLQLPWQTWLLGVAKVLYDREISVAEHHVKVSELLNNHSLIMGKQVINILPEGSAVLNPEHTPFCLSAKTQTSAALPIFFNSTVPAEIEFLRLDLDTGKEEVVKVPTREVNKLAKTVRDHNADPDAPPFHWTYHVKKPGVYRLNKVLDEYKLEVQRPVRDTYVVPCPQAKIRTTDPSDRCIRDLSNLSLDVVGTPPLKIKYSRTINGKNHAFHFQSLQPEGFNSPLLSTSGLGIDNGDDVDWVKPHKVTVKLNESMATTGDWEYSVEEVYDAFGNVVRYADAYEDPDSPKMKGLTQRFTVKERPKIRLQGCDLRNPIKVARGRAAKLPISFGLAGPVDDTSHKVTWIFSPIDSITNSGDHGDQVSVGTHFAKSSLDKPLVSEPGLYTLKSVSSGTCEGEVDEPSSCLLLNPLEPHLSLRTEEIPDKCAGNSVGLRVDLDLVGTPPFTVRYDIISDGRVEKQAHRVDGLRSQIELVPRKAGRYKYVFRSIDDDVYTGLPLTGSDKVLEQVVKPAASAYISNPEKTINACLESEVDVDVMLAGDPPFSLEWEIIHDGKRKPGRAENIYDSHFKIQTAALSKGGEYILALSSVQDQRKCRTFLQDQLKISVRRQRPRGAFGLIEQKNSIMAVEGTALRLPLRLQGEAPWTVSYRNLDGPPDIITKTINGPNDHLMVRARGTYELVDVVDKQCPGVVEPTASKFHVDWFPRPELSIVPSNSITPAASGVFVKQEVCEGDIDGFEVRMKGKFTLTATRSLLRQNSQYANHCLQVLPHTTSNMKSSISHCRAPPRSVKDASTRPCPRLLWPWTLPRLATTRTSSLRWQIISTTATSISAPWSSSSVSTLSRRRPSPSQAKRSNTVWKSKSMKTRFPLLLPASLPSTSRWRSSIKSDHPRKRTGSPPSKPTTLACRFHDSISALATSSFSSVLLETHGAARESTTWEGPLYKFSCTMPRRYTRWSLARITASASASPTPSLARHHSTLLTTSTASGTHGLTLPASGVLLRSPASSSLRASLISPANAVPPSTFPRRSIPFPACRSAVVSTLAWTFTKATKWTFSLSSGAPLRLNSHTREAATPRRDSGASYSRPGTTSRTSTARLSRRARRVRTRLLRSRTSSAPFPRSKWS